MLIATLSPSKFIILWLTKQDKYKNTALIKFFFIIVEAEPAATKILSDELAKMAEFELPSFEAISQDVCFTGPFLENVFIVYP